MNRWLKIKTYRASGRFDWYRRFGRQNARCFRDACYFDAIVAHLCVCNYLQLVLVVGVGKLEQSTWMKTAYIPTYWKRVVRMTNIESKTIELIFSGQNDGCGGGGCRVGQRGTTDAAPSTRRFPSGCRRLMPDDASRDGQRRSPLLRSRYQTSRAQWVFLRYCSRSRTSLSRLRGMEERRIFIVPLHANRHWKLE